MTDLPAGQRDELVAALLPHADDAAAHARGRPRHDPQDAVAALRRRAGRVGADALPRPGHDVRLLARPAAGWPARSARPARAGCSATCRPPRSSSRSSPAPGRWPAARCPGGPGRVSNVVFMGMGEPLANYKAVIGAVRRLTDPAPDGLGMSRPRRHRLDRRPGAADQPAGRGGHPGHAGAVPARARRRAAQRAGADQHPLLGRRDRRRGLELRAGHQAPGLDRVRHDARHQRPGLARRPARRRPHSPAATGAGCTST